MAHRLTRFSSPNFLFAIEKTERTKAYKPPVKNNVFIVDIYNIHWLEKFLVIWYFTAVRRVVLSLTSLLNAAVRQRSRIYSSNVYSVLRGSSGCPVFYIQATPSEWRQYCFMMILSGFDSRRRGNNH